VLVVLPGEPDLQTNARCRNTFQDIHKVMDKVRYKVGNSRIQILRTEDPDIITGNILRILKSYQAIYCLRMEDPEIIPYNILSQDRVS